MFNMVRPLAKFLTFRPNCYHIWSHLLYRNVTTFSLAFRAAFGLTLVLHPPHLGSPLVPRNYLVFHLVIQPDRIWSRLWYRIPTAFSLCGSVWSQCYYK